MKGAWLYPRNSADNRTGSGQAGPEELFDVDDGYTDSLFEAAAGYRVRPHEGHTPKAQYDGRSPEVLCSMSYREASENDGLHSVDWA